MKGSLMVTFFPLEMDVVIDLNAWNFSLKTHGPFLLSLSTVSITLAALLPSSKPQLKLILPTSSLWSQGEWNEQKSVETLEEEEEEEKEEALLKLVSRWNLQNTSKTLRRWKKKKSLKEQKKIILK